MATHISYRVQLLSYSNYSNFMAFHFYSPSFSIWYIIEAENTNFSS